MGLEADALVSHTAPCEAAPSTGAKDRASSWAWSDAGLTVATLVDGVVAIAAGGVEAWSRLGEAINQRDLDSRPVELRQSERQR